jgi:biopolymer transport protein ExbD
MRIRHSTSASQEAIKMQVTPMIDVVFLLLIFFIMSFKIVAIEGDFNLRMPQASAATAVPDTPLPPIKVHLVADDSGDLIMIRMGETVLGSFAELHDEVIALVGTDTGPGSLAELAEAEISGDDKLKYRYVIDAISAVSGHVDRETGQIIRLIQRIRFPPPEDALD